MIGTRLAHYEITASLGSGGMGQVYRATDTRLQREVAIKVLPPAFTADANRLVRFVREAQVLAQLHHPNVASIFDIEEEGPVRALILELIEGEDLDRRLARGPLALDDALPIIRQIAAALDAAHEKGIVHRDLKPGNIKLRADGVVKVLDFGLAKAFEVGSGSSVSTGSNQADVLTVTHLPDVGAEPSGEGPQTNLGAVVGTAGYMAPEQARGKPVDRRADIWAFGVLIWEMLAGIRLFRGETTTDVLASVLRQEIDWWPIEQVAGVRAAEVLRNCLVRDPSRRLSNAGDVALLLTAAVRESASAARPAMSAPAVPRPQRRAAAAIGLLLVGVIGGFLASRGRGGAPLARVERFSIVDPDIVPTAGVALSPDGRQLAFAVERDQGNLLAVRSFDRFDPVLYPGTEGATSPFFSPDGAWLGYFTRTGIRKVPIEGGSPRTVASFRSAVRFDPWNPSMTPTADWGADGSIVFSSGFWREPAALPGLFVVPAAGGEPKPLTGLDGKELGHLWPAFTPDGRSVLFTALGSGPRNAHTEAIEVASGARRRIQSLATKAKVLSSGHLVFLDEFYSRLNAVPIDPRSLELRGPPVPLIEGINTTPPQSFAVSAAGTLIYAEASPAQGESRLVRVGLDGSVSVLVERAASWVQPRTSPDGRRLVVREVGDECRLWLFDLERRTLAPFTTSGDSHQPIWTRSGLDVVYGREDAATGRRALFRQPADGSRPAEILLSGAAGVLSGSAAVPYPDSFTADDRALLFERSAIATGSDLWIAPTDGGAAEPFLESPAFEGDAELSPDGRWLAYVSDESGRQEVYVRAFPGKGSLSQVSVAGGEWPIWSRDGATLYFSLGRKLMAVDFDGAGQAAVVGKPRKLLDGFSFGRGNLDLLPDGESFVLVEPTRRGLFELRVVTGWTRELAETVLVGDAR